MVKSKQLKLAFKSRRGRPPASQKTRASYIWHRSRPIIPKGKPVHVTMKGDKNVLGTLRNKLVYKEIRASMRRARAHGVGIVEFSVQRDHVHMLIEPQSKQKLGAAMRAFTISLSKRLSHLAGKKIKAFKKRYHLHILHTIVEAQRARSYILTNGKKHGLTKIDRDWFSTNLSTGMNAPIDLFAAFLEELEQIVCLPQTWILRKVFSG